jgi:hypothetical protein
MFKIRFFCDNADSFLLYFCNFFGVRVSGTTGNDWATAKMGMYEGKI